MTAPPADPLPSPTRRNLLWWSLQTLLQVPFILLFRYRARGVENVPQNGPALLLVNHQSYLDPILLCLPLCRPICMVARKTLYEVPIIGRIIKGLDGLAIDQDAPGAGVIREIVRRLDHRCLVGIFPEGARSSGTELGEIKPGFISILRRADVPVIPVGIAGADHALPRGAKCIRPTRIRVVFGKPIPSSELAPLKTRGQETELLSLIRDRIQAEVHNAAAWRAGNADDPPDTHRIGQTC